MKKNKFYILLVFSAFLSSCSTYLYETRSPAVRLADCIRTAATSLYYNDKKNNLEIECNSSLKGEYIILLHPPKEYSNEEFINKGLLVGIIQKLRVRKKTSSIHGFLYVIPLFNNNIGSRTTSYARGGYVTINNWLLAKKNNNIVYIELQKTKSNSIIISNIK